MLGGSGDHLGQARAGNLGLKRPDECPGHLLGGSGEHLGQVRACASGFEHLGECPGYLRGGSGEHQQQARASTLSTGSYKECHGSEGAHQGQALHERGPLRESKCYYEQWKTSSPLQHVQIRPLSSTAILYKLMVRFQPGGGGPAATHHNAQGVNDPGGCICSAQLAQTLWSGSGSPSSTSRRGAFAESVG